MGRRYAEQQEALPEVTARQFATLLILAVTWGCSFVLIKVMSEGGMGGPAIASMRTALGFATIVPIVLFNRGQLRQERRTWVSLAGLGLFNFAMPWTIFGVAAGYVPSGAAAIVNSTAPLWVTLITVFAMKQESVSGLKAVGVALGFAGVVVLMGNDLGNIGGAATLSLLMIMVATLCYGCSALYIRRTMAGVPPVVVAGGQIGFATLFLAPVALLSGSYSGVDWNGQVLLSAVLLGAIGSGFGPIAYMGLIQQVGALKASVVTYLIPPVGVLLGWLLLNEQVGWNMIAGLGLILLGVSLTQELIKGFVRPVREPVVVTPSGGE
ncbi:MAG TPA: DMT family transporter [Tepidiformaceae bacterium]|nr:DMT family transporter [Tepidiformaceae bacterium]